MPLTTPLPRSTLNNSRKQSMKLLQFICLFLFILVSVTASRNTICPFDYLYHFGDGVTDIGNSVLVSPWGNALPPNLPPYGMTFPGMPNGRWSDGLIDFDFAASDFGFPKIVPYLSKNSSSGSGVIFSVARSPVLDRHFFTSRDIKIPPYAVSLRHQLNWFKTHLKSICSTAEDCARILGNSLVLLGDIEGNDIGYSLSQGKSIEEVRTYVPYIRRAQIKVTRELIKMGASRIIIPGNSLLGCYPYILTARSTNDSTAYDDFGCLRDVNDLIKFKNNDLYQAVSNLASEFPNISLYYGPFDEGVLQVLRETFNSSKGHDGSKLLRACCGTGGKYNYDSKRFCGSRGVPICSNPDEYIFWDGLHLTHKTSFRIEQILIADALVSLNCTAQLSASM